MYRDIPIDIDSVKGFLSPDEGYALQRIAGDLKGSAPALEIGSYCGKSTVYLGLGCEHSRRVLFALDHHGGSVEQQPGEMFFDPELVDAEGRVDTLRAFRQTMRDCALEDTVIPVVTTSALFARSWQGPLSMVFIDGGHALDDALSDYRSWAGFIEPGGILAIHDVYPAPESGGQAPIAIWRLAQQSGLFRQRMAVDSLRILQRL